jgi:GSH-dependent disulfide-bond oxidoreductase
MIDLYAWPTPNGQKISIMLEECGLDHRVIAVDINQGEQFDPGFLDISPNGRIPAIVDYDAGEGGDAAVKIFESGAILIYLAEKTGRFLPASGPDRYSVLQWLMFQIGGLGPMCGQAHHFRQGMGGVEVPYGIERYTRETGRLYQVMDRRLGAAAYLGGAEYSIADMACWPWARPMRRQGHERDDFPNLKRWFDDIAARPAVARGMELLAEHRGNRVMTDAARENLFGDTQFKPR